MPNSLKQLSRDAYCSAPPLTPSIRPPRLTRESEVRRPRAPPIVVKREVTSSIELAKFVLDEDFDVVNEKPIKIEPDPRQLCAGVAALTIRPPPSAASSSSGEGAAAPGPSGWGVRGVALGQIPGGELGPALRRPQRGHAARKGG